LKKLGFLKLPLLLWPPAAWLLPGHILW